MNNSGKYELYINLTFILTTGIFNDPEYNFFCCVPLLLPHFTVLHETKFVMRISTSGFISSLTSRFPLPQVSPQTRRRARASLSDIASLRDIEGLSVRQLKEILARNFVNYSGCCEKWELVERVSRLYRETEENRKSCGY